eukprot:699627-Amphidinium_carterae.1
MVSVNLSTLKKQPCKPKKNTKRQGIAPAKHRGPQGKAPAKHRGGALPAPPPGLLDTRRGP